MKAKACMGHRGRPINKIDLCNDLKRPILFCDYNDWKLFQKTGHFHMMSLILSSFSTNNESIYFIRKGNLHSTSSNSKRKNRWYESKFVSIKIEGRFHDEPYWVTRPRSKSLGNVKGFLVRKNKEKLHIIILYTPTHTLGGYEPFEMKLIKGFR